MLGFGIVGAGGRREVRERQEHVRKVHPWVQGCRCGSGHEDTKPKIYTAVHTTGLNRVVVQSTVS